MSALPQSPAIVEKNENSAKDKSQISARTNLASELLRKKDNKIVKVPSNNGIVERNDRYLFILLALICFLLVGIYYYYKKVINRSIPIIETAMAQEAVKKKGFLT